MSFSTPGYQRDIGHCEMSTYARPVTIKKVEPAYNSDSLDRIEMCEVAYEAISQRNLWKDGDRAIWIPGESIIPLELSEALGVTEYLSRGRVRTIRLRGNRSEGLLAPVSIAEPYLDKILKWESRRIPASRPRGPRMSWTRKLFHAIMWNLTGNRKYAGKNPNNFGQLRKKEIPEVFSKFYRMPNILNEPWRFKTGQAIAISEKIHGMNARFSHLNRPTMGWFLDFISTGMYYITGNQRWNKWQYYVGSHNTVLRDVIKKPNELFWRVFNEQLRGKMPQNYVFYGEVYGPGIQKGFDYGLSIPRVILFAAKSASTEQYLCPDEFVALCQKHGLPHIEHESIVYENIEQVRKLAEAPSGLTNKHIREGIVMVDSNDGNKMAKCVSFKYLSKNGRTEFH